MSQHNDITGQSDAVLERLAAALRVLAHPHRLRMVERLMKGELMVGDLAETVGLPPAACSQHLNLMRAHGILASRREGRSVYYRVINPAAVSVVECIHRHRPDT